MDNLTDEERKWLDVGVFTAYLRQNDVFGHRMCDDARAAASARRHEERIRQLVEGHPLFTPDHKAVFQAELRKALEDMR